MRQGAATVGQKGRYPWRRTGRVAVADGRDSICLRRAIDSQELKGLEKL